MAAVGVDDSSLQADSSTSAWRCSTFIRTLAMIFFMMATPKTLSKVGLSLLLLLLLIIIIIK